MNKAKFTKKMEVGTSTDKAPICVDGFCNNDGKRFEVCSVWGVEDDVIECDQSIANAHLIAAAPEMYEMLNKFILAVESDSSEDFLYEFNRIKSLLAKARGEHE